MAAAVVFLTGNGVFNTGANWQTRGSVLENDDEAYIPESLNADVGGNADIGGVKVDLLSIHENYRKNFTSSGSPFKGAADLVEFKGIGHFYYECSAGGGGLVTNDMHILAGRAKSQVHINSESGDAGAINRILVGRGDVQIKGDTSFGGSFVLEVGYMVNRKSDSTVNISSNANTIPTIRQKAGVITCAAPVTDLELVECEFTQKEKVPVNVSVGPFATFNLHHSAATTIIVHADGTLNIDEVYAQRVITNLVLMPGAKVVGTFAEGAHPLKRGNNAITNLLDQRTQSMKERSLVA